MGHATVFWQHRRKPSFKVCHACQRANKLKDKFCTHCGTELKALPSKFNNKSTVYKGIRYDSIKEAEYAKTLDLRILAGEVKEWTRQFKISLDLNGVHITNYFIDFRVTMADGSIEYHEVKGFETEVWRLKWLLSTAIYPDWTFVVIK